MPTFKSIKSELEDLRFYTKENYVRDHAADYISKINTSDITQEEKTKLWNLFVRRLMTILIIADGYGKASIINEGSKPSALPSLLTYIEDLTLYQINTSNLISYHTAANLFQENWAPPTPLEQRIKMAKASGKKAFFVSLVPVIIIHLLKIPGALTKVVPQSLVPMIVYAKALANGVLSAALIGGLFYLFARLGTIVKRIIRYLTHKKAVLPFEIIMKRLKAIIASNEYTPTMPTSIKKQIAAALSGAEQHTLPSNEQLKTKEGEKQLRARQLPMHNLFVALYTETVYEKTI